MFDKKKLNFWRLFIGFGGLVLIALMFLRTGPQEPTAQMMTGSMASMMANMHGSNITLNDFFATVDSADQSSGEADTHASHHEGAPSIMKTTNYLTTAIIFLLLPLILGGSILLAIAWFK